MDGSLQDSRGKAGEQWNYRGLLATVAKIEPKQFRAIVANMNQLPVQ